MVTITRTDSFGNGSLREHWHIVYPLGTGCNFFMSQENVVRAGVALRVERCDYIKIQIKSQGGLSKYRVDRRKHGVKWTGICWIIVQDVEIHAVLVGYDLAQGLLLRST